MNIYRTTKSNQNKLKIPFTTYDFGWVILSIGMAIGGGIVFMPIQIGLEGLWVFLVAVLFSYPALYYMQDLFLRTLMQSESCENYTDILSNYLGKNWGIITGVIYFLMLLNGILIYSKSITYDSASYLQTFHITTQNLSDYLWYGLLAMIIVVLISTRGELFLFKIAGPMIVIKFGIIIFLAIIIIPYWNIGNIDNVSGISDFFSFSRKVILTLPFALYSGLYVQILNPMNLAYRKMEKDPLIAAYRTIRANRIAYIVIITGVLFFSISFSFTFSHAEAVNAVKQNISALAIVTKVMPGAWIHVMSVLLNIFAVLTAFFGSYLGFCEALKGNVINLLSRVMNKNKINEKLINILIMFGIILFLWWWVSTDIHTILFLRLGSPLVGITAFLVPCYLIWKVESLKNLKSGMVYYIFLYGVFMVLSPFFIIQ